MQIPSRHQRARICRQGEHLPAKLIGHAARGHLYKAASTPLLLYTTAKTWGRSSPRKLSTPARLHPRFSNGEMPAPAGPLFAEAFVSAARWTQGKDGLVSENSATLADNIRPLSSGVSANPAEVVPRDGVEPPTLRFSVACSTN